MIIRGGVNIYPIALEAGIRAIRDEAGQQLVREAALIRLWSDARGRTSSGNLLAAYGRHLGE